MSEYESLRSEIISMEEQQCNIWLQMYAVFCALYALGIEFSTYLLLVTYIILIPFQAAINKRKWTVSKMSTYIRIFYEKENANLNWEGMHVYDVYSRYYDGLKYSVVGKLQRISALPLGLLATITFDISLPYHWYLRYCKDASVITANVILSIIVLVAVSWILLWVIIMLHIDYYKNYDQDLDAVIKRYKYYIKQ